MQTVHPTILVQNLEIFIVEIDQVFPQPLCRSVLCRSVVEARFPARVSPAFGLGDGCSGSGIGLILNKPTLKQKTILNIQG